MGSLGVNWEIYNGRFLVKLAVWGGAICGVDCSEVFVLGDL